MTRHRMTRARLGFLLLTACLAACVLVLHHRGEVTVQPPATPPIGANGERVELRNPGAIHEDERMDHRGFLSTPDESKDKSTDGLIDKLKSEDWTRVREASENLVNSGNHVVPSLLRALKEAPVGVKGQIIFILGRIHDQEATLTLLNELHNENPYIRRNTAEALGKLQDARALHALTDALFDDDGAVRQRAAWALGELGRQEATKYLLMELADERELGVKVTIVRSIGRLKDPLATPGLLNELHAEGISPYQNEVVAALGELADRRSLEKLVAYRDALKQNRPVEDLYLFEWQEALQMIENAVGKIQNP